MRRFLRFIPLLTPLSLAAVPEGLQVKHGQVQGPFLQGNEWVIQSGEKAVVHWDSFSADPGETLRFIQQSGTSAILNRIVGPNCSEILGTLVSNGSVYIINPNGVLIGPNGRIETAGFIASSLDILDIDFLEQKSILFSGSGLGKVVNLGSIESEQGSIFLIGNLVKNEGVIRADQGTIGLGVGNEILLQLEHEPRMLIRTNISGEKEEGISLEQSGKLEALKIELKSGSSLYTKAIQCSGIVDAVSVRQTEGMIEIFAPSNQCIISGSLQASGGKIHVLGEEIQLIDQAVLDTSAMAGGGEILIGGDYQGKNPNIFHAKRSFVGKDVILQADALEKGNGGKIIVWGDEATVYFGQSSVCGGPDGGDGGLVEVSGKYLDYQGLADRRAPNGKAGLLLLDPINITITNNAGVDSANVINPGGGGTYTFNACAPSPALIDNTLLGNNLNLGNVTINTSATGAAGCLDVGTIAVSSPVSWTAATTLALIADANIVITAPIANTNSTPGFMSMAFTAKGTTGTGNHGIYVFDEISSDAGSISLVGNSSPTGANINGILIEGIPMFARGRVKTTSGDIFIAGNVPSGPTGISAGIRFNLNGKVESSTGNIKLSAVSAVSHGLDVTDSVVQTFTTGTVTLGDPITDPNTSQVIEGCIGGSAPESHGIRLGSPFSLGLLNAVGDFIAINKIISGTGINSSGVIFLGPFSQIFSSQGNIQITARSRSTGGVNPTAGIFMSNTVSTIRALVGSITLIGIGSDGALPLNTSGFRIIGTGNTNKIFAGGDLRIAGINPQVAATTGVAAVSIFLGPFPSSITSGSGNIIISGVNNSTSANAHGVTISSNWTPINSGTIRFGDTITDPNGVTVTGCQGGSGSGSHGVNLNNSNWTLTQPLSFTNCVGGGSIGGSGYGINVPATSGITTSNSITVGAGGCLSGTGPNCIGASFAGNVTSTGSGAIIINATSQGSSGVCPGIQLSAATISATGSGAITLNGTGSASGGAGSYGVVITGANARVTSVDGDITFGSTGSGTTGQAYLGGTGITNVSTTGTGSILFSGAFLDSNFVPIISSTNNVSFSQAVILNALTSTIDLTGGSGDLTFSSTISGTSASVHNLSLLVGSGSITVLGAIDLSGQASTLNGGTFLASGGSTITLSDISTVGNPTLNAMGPNGGAVSVTSTAGGVSVGNINTSGATGTVTGGTAGGISLQPTQTYTSGSLGNIPNGILVLKGNLTASGGGPAGASGAISLSTGARGALMSIATITSSFAGNDVTLTGASVTTGPQEAMTIFGNLTMNVTGSITVTDLIALDAISLTATNLTQQAGTAGSLLDPFGNLNASSQSHIVSPVSITRNISGIETINGIIQVEPGLSRFALVYAPNSYILNSILVVFPPVPLPFSIAEQIIQLVIANTQMELLLPDPWHRTFLPPWERQRLFAEMPSEELFPAPTFREVDRNI